MLTKIINYANNLSPFNIGSHRPTPKMPWLINSVKFLVFSPIFIYFYSIYVYSTNIPFSDDYGFSLDPIISIIQSETLAGKLELLFLNSLEVLLLFNKITILLIYSFLGRLISRYLFSQAIAPCQDCYFFSTKRYPKTERKYSLYFLQCCYFSN